MATKFVYSGAVGTNDGSSWTNAWTSIVSAVGVAAGDIVKVHKTHSQTGITTTQNFSNGTNKNPVQIICVDKDASDALATGALIEWSGNNTGPQGNTYWYGVTISSSNGSNGPILQTAANNGLMVFENCTFKQVSSSGAMALGGGGQSRYIWRNCNIDMSGSSGTAIRFNIGAHAGTFEWFGGTYTIKASQADLFSAGTGNAVTRIYGVTFNGTVTNFVNSAATTNFGELLFNGCKLPTYTNLWSTTPTGFSQNMRMVNCGSGTLTTAALSPVEWNQYPGTVTGVTSQYRSNGASDGSQSTPYSWKVVTTSNAAPFFAPLTCPVLNRWVEAGASQTVTIYLASGGSLNNDDVWVELLSPSEAGSPTNQNRFQTSAPAILASNGALTTDSDSTWTGSGMTTLQKITFTISPTIAGIVQARIYVGKASGTIYIDPTIYVGTSRGRSRMMQDVQVFSSFATANLLTGKF